MKGFHLFESIKEMFSDYFARYENRYYGKYRAFVCDVDDPLQIGRIRVSVPALLIEAETDWCWPSSPLGGNASGQDAHGMMMLPECGDMIWVEFEEGNIGRPPIWTGGPYSSKALPPTVRAQPGLDAEDGVKGIPGAAIPPSGANFSEYGKVRIIQMKSGSKIEFDETEGEERIQIWHKSGGHLEIMSDGTVNVGGAGALRLQASQGTIRQYAGENMETTVAGDVRLTAKSEETTLNGKWALNTQGGDYLVKAGQITLDAAGDFTLNAGSFKVNRQGNFEDQTGGQYSAMAGTNWQAIATMQTKLVAQNSVTLGGLPTSTAMEVKGQNGKTVLESVDITGLASFARVEADGAVTMTARMEAGTPALGAEVVANGLIGQITLGADLPTAGVLLGGPAATNPVLKGTPWLTLWAALLVYLDSHTHNPVVGPPVVPASATLLPLAGQVPSLKVMTE